MPQTFKVVETIVLEDGSGLDQLAEALMVFSDMPFDLEYIGSNKESVTMVRLIRVAEKPPDQTDQIEAEEEVPDEQAEEQQAEDQQPSSSSSKPKFRQFAQGTILPRPPSRPPPANLLVEQSNEQSSHGKLHYKRLQPVNVFTQHDDQHEKEEPETDSEWHASSWHSSGWKDGGWKKRSNTECHVCGKVRAEHQNKKFCNLSWRK